ncbi:MAG: hypothetical protein WKF37_04475 [Bryobacteraceae bacterium]
MRERFDRGEQQILPMQETTRTTWGSTSTRVEPGKYYVSASHQRHFELGAQQGKRAPDHVDMAYTTVFYPVRWM